MPVNISLLPPELTVSKNLNNLLKTLKALGVIGVAAFLFFGIGVGVFFITSSISLNNISANVAKLKGQVSAQQKSEQQIILLKDRIAKANSVYALPSSLPDLAAIEPYLANLSVSTSINQMTFETGSIGLSVNLKTNSDLGTFIESLRSSSIFKSVSLSSFSYSPSSGYSVEVTAVRKK